MTLKVGDKILYKDDDKGLIVDIWRNNRKEITNYIVDLDSGTFTNIKPNYPNCIKLEDCFYILRRVVNV